MPVYAYACAACGHAFDARQSFDEPALTTCERCGGALRKQYGSIGVTFNGPGFYRTDSRSTGSSSSAASSGKGADASKGSSAKESSAPAKSAAPAATGGSTSAS
ncbi:FmdB family zinc ribbon protein [Agrococcus lahaulensis]|uniref:FmdB family zinc ribbon protein n=1 Tax=Agrococcus lahaulensis TaxID=341722 RepID=UPI000478A375|nr:FmdB family zinc ribbon protein [Agrococcus lahaulensis]